MRTAEVPDSMRDRLLWARAPLGDLVDFIRGVSFEKADVTYANGDGYTPILRAGNIGDALDLRTDLIWVPRNCVADDQLLRVGDIAICMSSGSSSVVGKTAQLRQQWSGSVGAFCGIVRPRRDINQDFLAHWFQSDHFRAWRDAQARGANIQNLRFSQLAQVKIPFPSLAEQERIAAELTASLSVVSAARIAAQEGFAAAAALPRSIYNQYFGDTIPFSAAPLVPIKPTSPGWTWHLLTELAQLATGHTPSRRCPQYWEGEIPWIQLPDIRALDGRRAMDTSEHINAVGIANSAAVILPAGTVCMSRTASVGFVTIMGRQMATSQDFVNWVCGPRLDPEFLMHLLICCRQPIRDLGSGTVHETIYFPTVQAFSVCAPPLSEQRSIAAELSRRLEFTESLTGHCRDELAVIGALKAAIRRAAFIGDS